MKRVLATTLLAILVAAGAYAAPATYLLPTPGVV